MPDRMEQEGGQCTSVIPTIRQSDTHGRGSRGQQPDPPGDG